MSTQANVFNLHNVQLHLLHSTGELGSKAALIYQDAHQTIHFDQEQLHRVTTDLGEEVTVVIRATVDQGSTTFTLVVPRVLLEPNQHIHIDTVGITALHRFSIIPPLNHGQLDSYSVSNLHGSAAVQPF
jgi:hypothetical protein